MTTSINLDFGSKDFKIAGLESKFDFIGVPNSFVRCFEPQLNRFETTVLYQLLRWHSWSNSGVMLRGIKWIYKSVANMIEDAFCGVKPGKLYRALGKLERLGFLQKEQLHREHFGDVHACAAYNRRNYYSPITEKVMECIVDTLTAQSPQTLSTLGFFITDNQIDQNKTTDFSKQENNTHSTSTSKLSQTPPLTPPGGNEESEPEKQANLSEPLTDAKGQVKGNLSPPCQNTSDSQATPLSHVVARPPRVEQKINTEKVEQKINTEKVVQKPVLDEAIAETGVNPDSEPLSQEVLASDVGSEVNTPTPLPTDIAPQKSRSKRRKNKKGTQPQIDFGQAPWTSQGQLKKFVRGLYESNFIKRQAQNRDALINWVLKQLKQGQEHSFWNDFISGLPIGASSQQEWEVEPGIPHPLFIEYLTEKLIKGNNTQTRESAISYALNVAANPRQAIFFWKECKISLGNALAEAERHRALGVQAVPTPLWTKERKEPTLEEAAITGMKIAQIHSSTEAAIEATRNRQLGGSTPAEVVLPQAEQTDPNKDDPWLDEVKPNKPKISDYASDEFKAFLAKGSDKKSRKKSTKRYGQRKEWRRQPLRIEKMNFDEINKALTDPILRNELTPQLIFDSDYELITDELGQILRIEKPPEF